MVDRVVVDEAGQLLDVLAQHFSHPSRTTWSKNTLRQRLRLGCIDVNGCPAKRHDDALRPGDVVEIHAKANARATRRDAVAMPVLFDDASLFVVDKPAGMLSVSTDDERERTALVLARQAASRPGHAADLWPVHRLDRETSGVLLFARSREVRDQLQADWRNTNKTYCAIVEGVPDPASGTIDQPLWEDKNLRVRVGARPDSKQARTHYETVRCVRARSQLEIQLETGRKHQIRAHLAWLGHPIVGDDRYGQTDVRLGLHARRLVLKHPADGREICLDSGVPAVLLKM